MLLRDIWHQRGQVLAAAMVVACGISAFVGMYSTYESLLEARAGCYERFRFADIFAQLKRAPLSVTADIRRIPGVALVEPRVVRTVTVDVPGLREPATMRLVSVSEHPGDGLNALSLMRGRYIAAGSAGEVLASETFARANGLQPGDQISAVINGRWQRLRIVGTALSPEYVYEVAPGGLFPDNRRFGVLWMNVDALSSAFSMNGAFNDVSLTLAPGASEAAVIERLDRLLAPYGGLAAYGRSEQLSNRFLSDELAEIRVMATMLPGLFLGVSSFLLYVVLSRVVTMQRAEIGLLKAFGYSNGSVGAHYLGFALVTAGIGVLVGVPAGISFARAFVAVYRSYFHFPRLDAVLPPEIAVLVALLTFLVAVGGALAAVRRAVRLAPAEAMRPELPARFRPGWLERFGLIRWLAPAMRMMFRNVTRRPVRAALSTVSIALAVALLVVGRFALDSVDAMLKQQFGEVQRDDVTAAFVEARDNSAVGDAARLPGVTLAEGFRAVPVWIRSAHRSKRVDLLGIRDGQELRRVVDQRNGPVRISEDGVVLGKKLAQILDVGPGDEVKVEALEGERRKMSVRVSATVDELLGLGAYVDARLLARMLGESVVASGVYLRVDDTRASELFGALKRVPAVASVSSRGALRASIEDAMNRSFNVFSVGLTAFAAVIVLGMVYNSMRVALSERGNELASLRVLGFTEGEMATLLLGEQALLTSVAVPVGLLLGYGCCALLVPAFDREAYRLPLVVSARTLAYAAATVLISAVGCGALVSRRIRRLDLIAVLKTRE